MTLKDIEDTLYDRLGFQAIPATVVTTRLRRFINETQREIISTRGCSKLRRAVLTFSTIANSPFAVLPYAAVNVITIADRVNDWILDPVSIEDLRAEDPGLTAVTSYPSRYVIMNYASAVRRSTSAQLFIVSTSATDAAVRTVYIEGVDSNGYPVKTSVSTNGTTAVTLGAKFLAPLLVTKFYIDAPAVGDIILGGTSTPSADEVATIKAGKTTTRYTTIHLHPVPSAAGVLYADVELHIEDMAIPGDEPYIPEDFQWVLVAGALMKEYKRRGLMAEMGDEKTRMRNGVADMKLFIRRRSGIAMGLNRGYRMRFSQLGPWYPAGS